jgi:hypothetical protein
MKNGTLKKRNTPTPLTMTVRDELRLLRSTADKPHLTHFKENSSIVRNGRVERSTSLPTYFWNKPIMSDLTSRYFCSHTISKNSLFQSDIVLSNAYTKLKNIFHTFCNTWNIFCRTYCCIIW